ncbi:MAG: argininosuccinate lyase [Saprospiraceae bacterium]|jgi:argininosuccinate lyase
MKLWDKGYDINARIQEFTIGKDRELDIHLAKYDVLGSKAHTRMLSSIGLIEEEENKELQQEMDSILLLIESGEFEIEEGIEDVHSQVELMLIKALGDIGKKIHLGRSRNDQVLLDLRLFFRDQLDLMSEVTGQLATLLIQHADKEKEVLMPGYTHMQIGMVSSFGMWFGGFAEALIDDMDFIKAVRRVVNRNPLGTAAGYGSSIPLDRDMTTAELQFQGLCINPINAQIGRGKTEMQVADAIASVALTINKMAMDICLFTNENYHFMSLPKEYTTGSSIMPHKKNPDVFELIRAKTNLLIALPGQIASMISNLSSGYHRDFQLQKEILFPAIFELQNILNLVIECIPNLKIHDTKVYDEQYKYLWSVEEVNKNVLSGMTFRDAYRRVGMDIEAGKYDPPQKIEHTHIGSINNLGLDRMKERLSQILEGKA